MPSWISAVFAMILRSWNRGIGPFITAIFKIYGALAFFSISFLILLNVTDFAGADVVEKISNDALLGVLALLVAFAALLAYIFKTEIRRELHEEVRSITTHSRAASRAETKHAIAYAFWQMSTHFKEEKFLSIALKMAESAHQDIQGLDDSEYMGVCYEIKNDLAYYLAEKKLDKIRALAMKDELLAFVRSGREIPYTHTSSHVELLKTCAWVIYQFAETHEGKEVARDIIRGLERRIAAEDFKSLRVKYDMNPIA